MLLDVVGCRSASLHFNLGFSISILSIACGVLKYELWRLPWRWAVWSRLCWHNDVSILGSRNLVPMKWNGRWHCFMVGRLHGRDCVLWLRLLNAGRMLKGKISGWCHILNKGRWISTFRLCNNFTNEIFSLAFVDGDSLGLFFPLAWKICWELSKEGSDSSWPCIVLETLFALDWVANSVLRVLWIAWALRGSNFRVAATPRPSRTSSSYKLGVVNLHSCWGLIWMFLLFENLNVLMFLLDDQFACTVHVAKEWHIEHRLGRHW